MENPNIAPVAEIKTEKMSKLAIFYITFLVLIFVNTIFKISTYTGDNSMIANIIANTIFYFVAPAILVGIIVLVIKLVFKKKNN